MGTACAPMGAGSGREFLPPGLRDLRPEAGSSLRWGVGGAGGTSIRDQSFLPVPCTWESLGDPGGQEALRSRWSFSVGRGGDVGCELAFPG